jgi:hypothetical protein
MSENMFHIVRGKAAAQKWHLKLAGNTTFEGWLSRIKKVAVFAVNPTHETD